MTPRAPQRRSGRGRNPIVVTNAIISANVGIFVWMALTDTNTLGMSGALSKQATQLVVARQFIEDGEWYRLISCGFVHFGLLHIAMNMYLLYQLGKILEPALGSTKFGLVYFASLLGGSAGALLITPDALTGGASGAVFGLMAAAIVGLRHRGVNPWRTGLGATFVINIVFTLAIPGVSVGGHFGGAIIGAACGAVLLAPTHWKLPQWIGFITPIALGALSVAVVALFVIR